MLDRGMMELTHAESPIEAWREFFEPGDVVGVKFNPVGQPAVISDASLFRAIFARLEAVGVKRRDIIAYERYGQAFQNAGFVDWLPEGIRWTSGSPVNPKIQLDMDGYDRDVYMEMPLIHPDYVGEYRIDDPHLRRSYVCKMLTQQVNKVINVPILKHHQSAGVTLALKNLSHGFTNNVSRSHASTTANACGIFIPAAVDLPIFREKSRAEHPGWRQGCLPRRTRHDGAALRVGPQDSVLRHRSGRARQGRLEGDRRQARRSRPRAHRADETRRALAMAQWPGGAHRACRQLRLGRVQ
jgi:hypothetical protein